MNDTRPPRARIEPWNDPAASAYVRIEGVAKSFGTQVAVAGVDLAIHKGEFFSLLGPSGCGKTTLLRMLAGFETPDAGRILIDGADMTGVPPHRRPVNMMFQSYALFPHMTVEQNIAFGLKQDGAAKAEIAERVTEMLALVKLDGFGRRKPHQLSGGQRQRVALARSLVKKPKLLLLDEPLGALDRRLREHTQFELVNIQERLGITFVIVTHDQEEAMTMSSRMAVMEHGAIRQVGTPAEVYERPASRFVAEFLGDANIIEGRVTSSANGGLLIAAEAAGCVIAVEGDGLAAGAPCAVAFRPEKLSLAKEPPADSSSNAVAGTVFDIAYLGDMSVYHVRADAGAVLRVAAANSLRLVERPITWDDRVWVTWAPGAGVVLSQ
jgi:putrescine transport system ATP-binding protein